MNKKSEENKITKICKKRINLTTKMQQKEEE